MAGHVSLSLVIHIHQPVGNFDHVIEQAYGDCYLPFLDTVEEHATVPHTLHVSGCLFEWLEKHHPEYLQRLSTLVDMGRIELMAGGFFEPILTMLPQEDRLAQIAMMRDYLKRRFGVTAETAWVPERVWEQFLAKDLAASGIKAVVLDDFHFLAAGLSSEDLTGPYQTEAEGELLAVFPGSERLRYLVPFHPVEEVIAHLESFSNVDRPLIVYADDGEKFGVWPGTKEHVYEKGWLKHFYQALEVNRSWLEVLPLKSALSRCKPKGKIWLPDASYREMTEWALMPQALSAFRKAEKELENNKAYRRLRPYVRGGIWRNFRHKYPEIDWMYARMTGVSRKSRESGRSKRKTSQARERILRSQCNCAWWHGIFGGFYLPHLRGAIWKEIIGAENACEKSGAAAAGIEVADLDFDGNEEARLFTPQMNVFVDPQGGIVREIDYRPLELNLTDTLARRYEAYHDVVWEPKSQSKDTTSIHEQTPLKEEGLADYLVYDSHPLAAFIDITAGFQPSALQLSRNDAGIKFWTGLEYECEFSEDKDFLGVAFERETTLEVNGALPIKLNKQVLLARRGSTMEVMVTIEPLGGEGEMVYGLVSYFNMLSDKGIERGATCGGATRSIADFVEAEDECVTLFDTYQGIELSLRSVEGPAPMWRVFPVYTVSSSESGLEKVYQASGVACLWTVPIKRYEPTHRELVFEVRGPEARSGAEKTGKRDA